MFLPENPSYFKADSIFDRKRNNVTVMIVKRSVAASNSKTMAITHSRIRCSPVGNMDYFFYLINRNDKIGISRIGVR